MTHVGGMRIVGVILIALGGYVLARGLPYKTSRDVVRIGDLRASVREERLLPNWTGGIAIMAGVILVFAGRRRRD